MDAATDTFTRIRPRLLGVAYRMLGSLAEAEDVVQDAWLSWHSAVAGGQVQDPEAWLVTTTTRRAIDRLRRIRTDREQYLGLWLPEPVLTVDPATPEALQEVNSDLSIAFLTVLERLAPDARAAYLLREVFDADYPDIAATLGKSEAACRQIVHRAKSQLREQRPRYTVSAAAHQRVMRAFAEAWSNADFKAMKNLMADSATLVGDGGGVVTSFPKPMIGGTRIAQLLFACTLRRRHELGLELAPLNGRTGILRYFGRTLESAQSFETDGERILRIHVQRNPGKLAALMEKRSVSMN